MCVCVAVAGVKGLQHKADEASLEAGGAGGAGGLLHHIYVVSGGHLVLGGAGHSVVYISGRLDCGGGLLVGSGGFLLSWVLQIFVLMLLLDNILGLVGVVFHLLLDVNLDAHLGVGDTNLFHSSIGRLQTGSTDGLCQPREVSTDTITVVMDKLRESTVHSRAPVEPACDPRLLQVESYLALLLIVPCLAPPRLWLPPSSVMADVHPRPSVRADCPVKLDACPHKEDGKDLGAQVEEDEHIGGQ